MQENKNVENVENNEVQVENTAQETQPVTNFDAKQIRLATEQKMNKKFEEEKQKIEHSFKEQLNQVQEELKQIKLEKEKINKEKQVQDKVNLLSSLGVRQDNIEDMMKLTENLETQEEIEQKVSLYVKPTSSVVSVPVKKPVQAKGLAYYRNKI